VLFENGRHFLDRGLPIELGDAVRDGFEDRVAGEDEFFRHDVPF
jgi:hypothetical protein